jgi:TM2 domain-containing membrane protein YozV
MSNKQLENHVMATVPPSSGSGAPRPDASKKVAAGVCGILIGGLGIHKFILGLTTPGLIMLLVTLLTCGIGGIVMGPIGLIEGIIYLTKSDEEFYQTYIVGKKAWF